MENWFEIINNDILSEYPINTHFFEDEYFHHPFIQKINITSIKNRSLLSSDFISFKQELEGYFPRVIDLTLGYARGFSITVTPLTKNSDLFIDIHLSFLLPCYSIFVWANGNKKQVLNDYYTSDTQFIELKIKNYFPDFQKIDIETLNIELPNYSVDGVESNRIVKIYNLISAPDSIQIN